jgi:UDP-N-acetylglucosamine 2-epimerase (non-hydrolysing)
LEIAVVVGTRPEIIKMSPVIGVLKERKIDFSFVVTGQHEDYDMSMRFVHELGLPTPSASFQLGNSSPASQIGEIMAKLEEILKHTGCTLLLIQGDTNSMLAAAVTGVKLGLRIAHVEAGLRSYDWRMPEEHNRRMVDHVSDILFAPTKRSEQNLINEQVHGRIVVTGNTVVDAVNRYLPLASTTSEIMSGIPFSDFCFATVHRKENVDSADVLDELVGVLVEMEMPVVFPVHPRTNLRLREFGLYEKLSCSSRICLLPPIGYLDTLVLMKKSRFILTDSGGLQEEATVPSIRKHVIVVRSSTERPEAVEAGFAKVVGVNKESIQDAIKVLLDDPPPLPNLSPFGDGKASQRIVNTTEASLCEQR